MAATKGKMGPVYTHPNIDQGGAPSTGEPTPSVVHCGKDDFKKGTAGRKTWPGMPVTGN